ncbi:tyrosine-type recombinase/integrase [Thomasclavelia cocleata]|jgi:integrase|uniref:tyrosine-type recombinase/integrase n=1 Tax=Thomasclavelia cocleata TaxID=69824 RepID=UPI00242C3A1E|nr:site-specific integrase [Thomasclavelia cocleata]
MTLNELFKEYLDDIDLTHQDTTLDSIKYRYNTHIKPVFGDNELNDISIKKIRRYQKDFMDGKYLKKNVKEKYSVNYINIIIQLLKRLIKYANIRHLIILDKDYIEDLDMIKDLVDKSKIKDEQIIWTIEEFENFIIKVDDKKFNILFNLLFYCGLRKGEVISLKWKNLDLIEGTVTINSTSAKVRGKGQVIKAPKTANSYRTIYLHSSLHDKLLEYYLEIKKEYIHTNDLFVCGGKKMISFSTLDRRFEKYKKLSRNSDMNLHGFRHSHATFLLSITNKLYAVSKRLGHDSIEVTELYLHNSSAEQKELADIIEKQVNNIENSSSFEGFITTIEKMILKQLNKTVYNEDEINTIMEMYKYVIKIKK